MIYTVRKSEKYFWAFNDNLEAQEKDRAYALIGFPSMNGLAEIGMHGGGNSARIDFLCHVKSLHNFTLEIDGEKIEATPELVWDTEDLWELASELKNQYKKMTSVNKKKLALDSGSSTKDSQPAQKEQKKG